MKRGVLIASGSLVLCAAAVLIGATQAPAAAASQPRWFAAAVDGASASKRGGGSFGEAEKLTKALNELEASGYAPGQVVFIGDDRAIVLCQSK